MNRSTVIVLYGYSCYWTNLHPDAYNRWEELRDQAIAEELRHRNRMRELELKMEAQVARTRARYTTMPDNLSECGTDGPEESNHDFQTAVLNRADELYASQAE